MIIKSMRTDDIVLDINTIIPEPSKGFNRLADCFYQWMEAWEPPFAVVVT